VVVDWVGWEEGGDANDHDGQSEANSGFLAGLTFGSQLMAKMRLFGYRRILELISNLPSGVYLI
jgi:hypothetical protein